MPRAGSSYVWTVRALNGPAGFVLHVVWWAGIAAAMGFIAFTFGTFSGNALAAAGLPPADADFGKTGHMIVGLAAIWIVFGVHVSGVQTYGRVVSVLLVLVVGVTVVVCVVGFATAPADFLHAASARSGVLLVPPATPAGFNLSAFLSVCALFIFAYGGLSGAPSLAGEARDAPSTLPRAIVLASVTSIILFTLVATSLMHAAPWWAAHALILHKQMSLVTAPGIVSLVAPRRGWMITQSACGCCGRRSQRSCLPAATGR